MDKLTPYQSWQIGQHGSYPTRQLLRTLWHCLDFGQTAGPLSVHCLTDAPAKLAGCLAAEASLYMFTIHHQCNGSILLIWGRRTGTGPQLPPHDIWWCYAKALGEHLKGSSWSLPHEAKLILVIRNLHLSVFPMNVLEDKVLLPKHFLPKHRGKK